MFEHEVPHSDLSATTEALDDCASYAPIDWAIDPSDPTGDDDGDGDVDDVQMKAPPSVDPAIYGLDNDVHAAAASGIATPADALPFLDRIQASFGLHDVSAIQAHVGGTSAAAMGATAYATGNHVVFDQAPDLHTAAHEAAHVIQQAHGVNLYGGVGEAGDDYERAADAIADRVVAGESAADLLGAPSVMSAAPTAVQRKESGPPQMTRSDYTMRADGGRAQAVSAQLRLAAMKINAACDAIDAALAAPPDNRGPQGVVDSLQGHFDQANAVQSSLHPYWEEIQRLGFKDGAMRHGMGIFNSARFRINTAQQKVRQYVSRNQGTVMDKTMNSDAVDRTAGRFASTLGVSLTGQGAVTGKEDPNVDEVDLIKETVSASLGAVDASSTALAMAMREADPKASAPAMAARAVADLRMLQQSIPENGKTSAATMKAITSIALRIEQAWIDGQPFGLQQDGNMIMARQTAQAVKQKLAAQKNLKAPK